MQKVILKDQNFPISEDNNSYKINGRANAYKYFLPDLHGRNYI